jgi:hypothetical protein
MKEPSTEEEEEEEDEEDEEEEEEDSVPPPSSDLRRLLLGKPLRSRKSPIMESVRYILEESYLFEVN